MADRSSTTDQILQHIAHLAADYLNRHADHDEPVVRLLPPDELRKQFTLDPPVKGRPIESLFDDIERILRFSVRTGHVGFTNQLYGGYDVVGIIGEWVTALLNASMYTYEVVPVATLMEIAVLDKMCGLVGFKRGEGTFLPGGTMSNLMATLIARDQAIPNGKTDGLRDADQLVMFTSAEAHYSFRRAAGVLGMGLSAVRTVDVDQAGRMLPDALERAVERAKRDGCRPFFICATSGTTVAGAYDPIEPIAEIAGAHGMWLHVDAAYGGGALLSRTHRHLLAGSHLADSLTWCPHKMMGAPLLCSVLLVRERGRLAASTAIEADYLFHDDWAEGSCDLGHLSLQCGRRIDAIKLWLAWQALGDEGFEKRIDRKFELARMFRSMIESRDDFTLVREPHGCNVCFHYLPAIVRNMPAGAERDRMLDRTTTMLREQLKQDGRILMNYAPVDGIATFRIVMNNADAARDDLAFILDEMQRLGEKLPLD
ncbi:MAG: aspartate aminotransferase family protein [Phycisphaerales bacterium]|nr:aspartate aminotransferase family protein [Phycisphaerales bacterium]